jgi:branched-chain amino acid transport system ATP-binding protein
VRLEVEDLSVHYGRIAAVRGVSVQVEDGETICLTGPNGAGKSTLLLAIAGGVAVTGGSVRLDGRELIGSTPETIARQGISLVPEGRHIFSRLTVEENLYLGSSARPTRADMQNDLKRVFDHFPILRDRASSMAGTLSGGEQQQLAIGRALMARPQLLLLDEPSLGLAPLVISHVYEIIDDLRRAGITFIIVEESITRALEAADRVYVMSSGVIKASGRSTQLAAQGDLNEVYFGVTSFPADGRR